MPFTRRTRGTAEGVERLITARIHFPEATIVFAPPQTRGFWLLIHKHVTVGSEAPPPLPPDWLLKENSYEGPSRRHK